MRRPAKSSKASRRSIASLASLCLVVPAVVLADGTVQGTAGNDVLTGTTGADSIFALAGDDKLDGAAGADDLDGGTGADDIHGGTGRDSVLYGGRSAAVAVTLNDLADDGQQGEGDNVHADVEQILGGDGGDRLNGDDRAQLIDGGAGDDAITDGGGRDRVYGGAGNDVLTTFDSDSDIVDCGAGSDTATADGADVLIGCERRLPGPRIRTPVRYEFRYLGAFTRFTLLVVNRLPGGGSVEVRCRGGGCPFATNRVKAKPGQTRVTLTNLLRGRRLRAGATLEIRVVAPQTIGRVERFRVRSGKGPTHTVLCLPPGSNRPKAKC
jgi:hypothetical protein